MLVSIIAALDRRGLIGAAGGLPWHLPDDLRRFRTITWGKPLIMGRRTFESIGKPLPGRLNIVLTQKPDFSAPGFRVARTMTEALALAEDHVANSGGDEAMIIGGGTVYAEAIERWDRMYLTVVEGEFAGGTYFPLRMLLRQSWRPTCAPEVHPADAKNRHPYSFHILERIRDAATASPQRAEAHSRAAALPESAVEGLDLLAILSKGR